MVNKLAQADRLNHLVGSYLKLYHVAKEMQAAAWGHVCLFSQHPKKRYVCLAATSSI
jgi:hypothetical protein